MELAGEAGGKTTFNIDDPKMVDIVVRRLRKKGIDPETGQLIN